MGLGDVQKVRQEMERIEVEYRNLEAQIKEQAVSRRSGPAKRIINGCTNLMYNVEQLRKPNRSRRCRDASTNWSERRLLRQEVDRRRNRRSRERLDRHSRDADAGDRTRETVGLEERLHLRVVGQDEAVMPSANAVRRSRSGIARSESADRIVLVSRTDRRRKNGTLQGTGRKSCSTTSMRWCGST